MECRVTHSRDIGVRRLLNGEVMLPRSRSPNRWPETRPCVHVICLTSIPRLSPLSYPTPCVIQVHLGVGVCEQRPLEAPRNAEGDRKRASGIGPHLRLLRAQAWEWTQEEQSASEANAVQPALSDADLNGASDGVSSGNRRIIHMVRSLRFHHGGVHDETDSVTGVEMAHVTRRTRPIDIGDQ